MYDKGIINNKGEYVLSKIPVGAWNFKCGYDNITFNHKFEQQNHNKHEKAF